MIGAVVGLQPRLSVTFLSQESRRLDIEFVIDTGFAGSLSLPKAAVEALGLPYLDTIEARLADGTHRFVDVFDAVIVWNGVQRSVGVLAMGERALLGGFVVVEDTRL